MNEREDLVFWACRWRAARDLFKHLTKPYPGVVDLAMLNYMTYLCEVFTFMFDQKEKSNARY